jgi:hypothetical protein
MKIFPKLNIIAICSVSLLWCGCNTICFYENINGEDIFVLSKKIIKDKKMASIRFNYLEQWNLWPWSDFNARLVFPTAHEEYIQVIDAVYDIYTLDGKLISPIEQDIDLSMGYVENRYKYSVFFPVKVKAKIGLKFYYNGEYHEYLYEAILTKKRNRTWWSVVSGI